jgi:hypothetical protein
MPRGVYDRGKRSPRTPAAGPAGVETAMAGSAVDDQERDEAPPEEEPTQVLPDLVSPLPEAPEPVEETPEQREIKQLRDQLAKLAGKRDVTPEVEELSQPGDSGNIVIHFLEDGFSALGRVFYRGEELEFEPGSQAYKDTCDKNGYSWLAFRHKEFDQVDRWGKIMFRNGPWPGRTYLDGTFEGLRKESGDGHIAAPSKAELAAAETARRRRAAPKLPAITA